MGSNIVAYMVTGVTNRYSTTEMFDEVSEWCECVKILSTSHVFPFFLFQNINSNRIFDLGCEG